MAMLKSGVMAMAWLANVVMKTCNNQPRNGVIMSYISWLKWRKLNTAGNGQPGPARKPHPAAGVSAQYLRGVMANLAICMPHHVVKWRNEISKAAVWLQSTNGAM
jgi:hypothetical protein